jgi:hypothetical protein
MPGTRPGPGQWRDYRERAARKHAPSEPFSSKVLPQGLAFQFPFPARQN